MDSGVYGKILMHLTACAVQQRAERDAKSRGLLTTVTRGPRCAGTAFHSAIVVPRRYPGRWVAAAILLVLLALFAWAIVTNPRFEWPVVWEYLFARPILAGLGLTIELTLIATVLSLVAGTLLALMRMSANPVLSTAAAVYIWFFRSVPLLVQIIFFYNFSALYPHIELGLPYFGLSFGTINVNAIISPLRRGPARLWASTRALTRPRQCAAASRLWMPGSGRPPNRWVSSSAADRPLRRSAAGCQGLLAALR